MCLIAFAWQAHPQLDLVVAANRDEFHQRPTEAAHWWQEPAGTFGGRDREAGGAWCAVDRHGRFAAVTNVREPARAAPVRSRGQLVRDNFAEPCGASAWAARMAEQGPAFGPFNLLVGDRDTLWFVSNRGSVRHMALRPGVHAISNGHWGDHWPKTERAQDRLQTLLGAGALEDDVLCDLLADTDSAPAEALPDTGIGDERERFLSPLFIRSAMYGTRASTVIRRDRSGRVHFHERGFDADARITHRVDQDWRIDKEDRS